MPHVIVIHLQTGSIEGRLAPLEEELAKKEKEIEGITKELDKLNATIKETQARITQHIDKIFAPLSEKVNLSQPLPFHLMHLGVPSFHMMTNQISHCHQRADQVLKVESYSLVSSFSTGRLLTGTDSSPDDTVPHASLCPCTHPASCEFQQI